MWQPITYGPAALLPSCVRVWKFPPRIPLLCSSSAGEKKKKEKQQQSAAFPLLRKSRAGEFLAGTFKRACMTVIKRQDLKWWAACSKAENSSKILSKLKSRRLKGDPTNLSIILGVIDCVWSAANSGYPRLSNFVKATWSLRWFSRKASIGSSNCL